VDRAAVLEVREDVQASVEAPAVGLALVHVPALADLGPLEHQDYFLRVAVRPPPDVQWVGHPRGVVAISATKRARKAR
jgi:hypothetical protein